MTLRSLLLFAALVVPALPSFAQTDSNPLVRYSDPVKYLKISEAELANPDLRPFQRMMLLKKMAPAALAARDAKKAVAFAEELRKLGLELRSPNMLGNDIYAEATFMSNLVLGLVAVRQNQIEKAKEHLLKSGDIPTSMTLKTVGPTMALAEELLERGEDQTVLRFLEQCRKFWTNPSPTNAGQLDEWKSVIENGGIPDFGPQLRSRLNSWRNPPPDPTSAPATKSASK
jgi:hypothetical protein